MKTDEVKRIVESYRSLETFLTNAFPKLTATQTLMLIFLHEHGPTDVMTAFATWSRTTSYNVDHLEARDFIKKTTSKDDKRFRLIKVTGKGRKLAIQAVEALKEFHPI